MTWRFPSRTTRALGEDNWRRASIFFSAPSSWKKPMLTFKTMTVDRFPLAGVDGGRYVRGNIRPACGPCNSSDGTNQMLQKRYGYEDQF